jgi:Tfp pilus assembly protein PilO
LKDSENKYAELLKENEMLGIQLADLKKSLAEKESEANQLRQYQRISDEMGDRLSKAYNEFNTLQEKLQKLENNYSQPQRGGDYEQLHESYFKLTKDYDEARQKQIGLWEENQRLSRILSDTEDKLREANFQRMQFQKKVAFLEELNNDLQQVSEHHKKLDGQLRRISEMEALLTKATQPKADYRNEEGKS